MVGKTGSRDDTENWLLSYNTKDLMTKTAAPRERETKQKIQLTHDEIDFWEKVFLAAYDKKWPDGDWNYPFDEADTATLARRNRIKKQEQGPYRTAP